MATLKAWSPEDERAYDFEKTSESHRTPVPDKNKVVFETKKPYDRDDLKTFHEVEETFKLPVEKQGNTGKVVFIIILLLVLLGAFISIYSDEYMYDNNPASTDFCVVEPNVKDVVLPDTMMTENNMCEYNNFEITEG